MNRELTRGPVMRAMLAFALPMIAGNLLQQCYHIADTLIVGHILGKNALAAVKIDAFAYMPVQDFGNAFSTFIAQNFGAGQGRRIRRGLAGAAALSMVFCAGVSALVCLLAEPLMALFVGAGETDIIREGMRYLRIEGAFYAGIGCLFLLYGLYRALGRPGMSVVLTVISLGTRVALAYALSALPQVGVTGIWWSVPIGWLLADAAGIGYYLVRRRRLLPMSRERITE